MKRTLFLSALMLVSCGAFAADGEQAARAGLLKRAGSTVAWLATVAREYTGKAAGLVSNSVRGGAEKALSLVPSRESAGKAISSAYNGARNAPGYLWNHTPKNRADLSNAVGSAYNVTTNGALRLGTYTKDKAAALGTSTKNAAGYVWTETKNVSSKAWSLVPSRESLRAAIALENIQARLKGAANWFSKHKSETALGLCVAGAALAAWKVLRKRKAPVVTS